MTRKVLIVVLGTVLGCLGAWLTSEPGPAAHAATLEISTDPGPPGDSGPLLAGALQSPATALRVVDALKLTRDPVFADATGWREQEFGEMSPESAAGFLLPPHGFVVATAEGPDGPVVVTATTPHAGLAAALVEAYAAEAPVAWREGVRQERASTAALLRAEVDRQAGKVQRAEEAWQTFLLRHGSADFEDQRGALEAVVASRLETVKAVEGELRQLDEDLAAVPALAGDLRRMALLPSFAADPELLEIHRRIRASGGGPQVDGDDALAARVLVILGQLEGHRAQIEERLERLRKGLAAEEEKVRRSGVLRMERDNLASALQTERGIHEAVQARLRSADPGEVSREDARLVRAERAATVRAISGAVPADRLVFGTLAGLLLSTAAAFAVHLAVDRRPRDD